MPDFTWKQGDTGPALLDSLTYSDGSAVDLTNASVSLVLRSLTAPGALTLTGTVRYTDRPNGGIAYQPSAQDTAIPGSYMANWSVAFPGGGIMSFPTVGYMTCRIEESLKTSGSALSEPFITAQDLSDAIGIDVTNDPGAFFAIDAACDICRDIAEQDFTAGTTTESYDGTGSDALILAQRPVTSVGAVLVNGVPELAFTFTPGGMLCRGSAGSGWFGGGLAFFGPVLGGRPTWPRGRQNITVTYSHGFTEVPRSVRMVALQIASRSVLQGVAKSETVGDVTAAYAVNAADLSVNELRILNKYRSVRS